MPVLRYTAVKLPDNAKLTVQSDTPETDFLDLKSELAKAIQGEASRYEYRALMQF